MNAHNQDLLDINGTRATVSLAASANLRPVFIGTANQASIQLVFTGTPAGAFKLQVSNDLGNVGAPSESAQYATVTNWSDVADSSATISAAGDLCWELQNTAFEWVRVVWTASGAGTAPVLTIARSKVKGV